MSIPITIMVLLFLSTINLSVMIPGGFIESRDFSKISPVILGGFNLFLTVLGIISLFIPYFIYHNQKWSIITAICCGFSYFVVYVIDLLKIFPKTDSPMPKVLFILEFVGILISLPLIYFSAQSLLNFKVSNTSLIVNSSIYWFIGIATIIGLGIIIFATKSAMTKK